MPVDRRMAIFRLVDDADEDESGASGRRRPQVGRTGAGTTCFFLRRTLSGRLMPWSSLSVSTWAPLDGPDATGAVKSSRSKRSSFVVADNFDDEESVTAFDSTAELRLR